MNPMFAYHNYGCCVIYEKSNTNLTADHELRMQDLRFQDCGAC